MNSLSALFRRDCALFLRRRQDGLSIIGFFLVAVALYPLAISPVPEVLRTIAPGAIWIAALFATILALERLFTDDLADGTLEQQLLAPQPITLLVAVRLLAHWLFSGLPLVLLAPLIGYQFALTPSELVVLTASLVLGTPALVLIGAIGAALTCGLRGSGGLITLLLLPLYVPVLVLGTAAVTTTMEGGSPRAPLLLLGAILAGSIALAPWATAAALRITTD